MTGTISFVVSNERNGRLVLGPNVNLHALLLLRLSGSWRVSYFRYFDVL